MLTNDGKNRPAEHAPPKGDFINHPDSAPESVGLGYETTDVNVSGIVVFIGGLFGFVIIFFFFCFLMGRVINEALDKQDGPIDKWHHQSEQMFAGAKVTQGKREDLKSNAAIVQQELQQMTKTFPNPRLDTDDGNQSLADLHAREDLLLDHYSSTPGQTGIRIPIERAMELIAAKGLPVSQAVKLAPQLAEDNQPVVRAPLTTGFARTGYELETMEAREQRLAYGKAESSAHAELKPVK